MKRGDPPPPLSERWKARLKNNPVVAALILITVALVGLATLADSVTKIRTAFFGEAAKSPSEATSNANQKPLFDLDDNSDIKAKNIKSCGDLTIVKARGDSKLELENGSFVAPNSHCPFPPPTDEMKRLSNKEIRDRVAKLSGELQAFQVKIDGERTTALSDNQRREVARRAEEEFRSVYLERATSLASAILAQIGPFEIPEGASNDIKAMQRASAIRLGRSSLYFGKPIGIEPANNVDNFLRFVAEKLPQ